MSHSALFVFLVALAAIALVNGSQPCQGSVALGNWGGKCFGTRPLSPRQHCSTVIYDTAFSGCLNSDANTCCVDCNNPSLINKCGRKWTGSVSRNIKGYLTPSSYETTPCCPDELLMGPVPNIKTGSGCYCCKHCKPKQGQCRGGTAGYKSRCVTKDDPVYSEKWCTMNQYPNGTTKPVGQLKPKQCNGNGCICCKY